MAHKEELSLLSRTVACKFLAQKRKENAANFNQCLITDEFSVTFTIKCVNY